MKTNLFNCLALKKYLDREKKPSIYRQEMKAIREKAED